MSHTYFDTNLPTTDGTNFADVVVDSIHYPIIKMAIGSDLEATTVAEAAPLPVQLSDGTNYITTLPVSLASVPTHAVTQSGVWNITDVSGTISLPTGAATAAKQDTGNTSLGTIAGAFVADGTAYGVGVLMQGDDGSDRRAVLVDTDGHLQLDVLTGAGTFYTEDGIAPANPIGPTTLAERDDALGGLTPIEGDWSHWYCNANGAFWVAIDGVVPASQSGTWNITNVSGTVSLPTGAATAANQSTGNGHLGNIVTAVQIMDDWDETNRCAVNPIASQVGIAADAGATDALTTRVVIVTDQANIPVITGTPIDELQSGSASLTIKRFNVTPAGTGDTALVAAVSDKIIKILEIHIVCGASTNAIYLNDGTADLWGDSTDKLPLDVTGVTAPSGYNRGFHEKGHFETAAVTRAVNINLGSAQKVIVQGSYIEV